MNNDVIVREAGYRRAGRRDWSADGLVPAPRFYRFTKSEFDGLIQKAETALETAADSLAAERAARMLAGLGSRVVEPGVLQALADSTWLLRKSQVDEAGEPVTLAGRLAHGRDDYANFLGARRAGAASMTLDQATEDLERAVRRARDGVWA
jgi:hypothetical protein